ncbi:hypothetical protein SY89_00530 [Halolamina pelagica]|uniref:YigZ family protein n=1 Tax=Halolamina pelagica TaxID=699431 RepID=A0A0P7GW97_9EURY|nr:YigZ family protein [Halolamina pelagica]KPN29812.1 hypothetical protein SY89_00530 [Halolamina pelagica]
MTDPEPFRTVAGRGEARFEIRGSEFIGHVDRADSVDAAESFVDAVRERYDDATHNVPAYRVPAGDTAPDRVNEVLIREYQSDDGEPTGSSGKPALNVLQQRDLRNVVAVVTRYYGGTNLGVGGLARAYSRAVKEAVDDAGVEAVRPRHRFTVTVEYDDSGTVRGILDGADCEFDAAYEAEVAFDVSAPVTESDELRDRIQSATSGRARIE